MVKIKIYTKDYCPYCHRAKSLLDGLKIKYEEIQVKTQKDMEKLVEKTNMMTVPQIFIDNNLIGGCDDLFALKDSGKLKELISN